MPTPKPSDVRKWARDNGLNTADRGRLPRDVLEAYAAVHSDPASDAAGHPRTSRQRSSVKPAGGGAGSPRGRTAKDRSAAATSEATNPALDTDQDQRLRVVETQLADVLERLAALESRATRSLLGLRTTL